jgi:pimeloyl-ACP methyl ester carboxylesterase
MGTLFKWCKRLLVVGILSAVVVVVRFVLRTPQALESKLPGEARLYRWRHGQIFYKVAGQPEAPALVLLHAPGIGSSAYEMQALMEQLQQSYCVYAPDLCGFGLSDKPALEYSAGVYISFCRDFLREVVRTPAILVASGLSCQYAVAVGASSPELCERLVLLSPLPLLEPQPAPRGLAALASIPLLGFVLYALVTTRPLLKRVLLPSEPERVAPDASLVAGLKHVLLNGQISVTELDVRFAVAHQLGAQRAVLALWAGKLDMDVSTQLAGLRIPVQVIWGERLAQIPGSQRLPGDVSVILRAGLAVHEERPTLVTSEITNWRAKALPVAVTAEVQSALSLVVTAEVQSESATSVATQQSPASIVELQNGSSEPAITQPESASAEESPVPILEEKREQLLLYCVKCRKKQPAFGVHKATTKNGRNALEGTCSVCNTKLFRFIATK